MAGKRIELYKAVNGAETRDGVWAPCCICGHVTLIKKMEYVGHIYPQHFTPWACKKCVKEEGLEKVFKNKGKKEAKMIDLKKKR